jgi:hypothetical protein
MLAIFPRCTLDIEMRKSSEISGSPFRRQSCTQSSRAFESSAASKQAAKIMSPAAPEKQSKCAWNFPLVLLPGDNEPGVITSSLGDGEVSSIMLLKDLVVLSQVMSNSTYRRKESVALPHARRQKISSRAGDQFWTCLLTPQLRI